MHERTVLQAHLNLPEGKESRVLLDGLANEACTLCLQGSQGRDVLGESPIECWVWDCGDHAANERVGYREELCTPLLAP